MSLQSYSGPGGRQEAQRSPSGAISKCRLHLGILRENLQASLSKLPPALRGWTRSPAGGLPRGRPTLVCGSAGSGKTLLAMEFLVRGAVQFGEPGVILCFDESPEDLASNVRSLGFDLDALVAEEKLAIDFVNIERSEIEETGEYDLEGLFIRLGLAIDSVAESAWCSTLWRAFSAGSPTRPSSVRSCAVSFGGSRIAV